MKARIVRYGFIGVVAVLIILCGMKFSNMYKDYQKLQFNQEQIDTQVSVLMSMLFSDLYYSDPIDLGETKEHADELSVLLQVTSYDEIPHFNDIANKLIEISKNVESRPAFSEQTIELFQSFIYNLGKPLSDDIDTALAVTLMHKDFLNKLIEHGNRQLVEVLILVNQSDKTVSVLFVLLVALDSLFQNRDFSGKLGLLLFILSVQSGISAVRQLS